MATQQTCGQGLAARSTLQETLGELIGAVGDVLEHHISSLDLSNDAGEEEKRAYESLVARHREVAAELSAIGEEMRGYRDLAMAGHDVSVLTSSRAVDVFERAVAAERELLGLLGARLAEDEELLASMRGAQA